MGIPKDAKSYTVTKFLNSGEMQEVAVDANRISTGGPIVILVEKE
jgi:hypothetical protein